MRLRMVSWCMALVAATALSVTAHPAAAQVAADFAPALESASDADRVEATNLAGKGNAAWERGDYDNALEYFRLAYRIYPSPRLQYNFGLAYAALGNKVEAATAFAAFLLEAGDAPESALAYARVELAGLDEQLGHVTLVGSAQTRLTLDGVEVASGKTIRVAPGVHAAVAVAPDRRPVVREFQINEGDERTIELVAKLAVSPAAQPSTAPVPLVTPTESRPRSRRWLIWTGAAVIAASVVTAIILSRGDDEMCPASDLGCVGITR